MLVRNFSVDELTLFKFSQEQNSDLFTVQNICFIRIIIGLGILKLLRQLLGHFGKEFRIKENSKIMLVLIVCGIAESVV